MLQAIYQIRIGDEGAAESDQVAMTAGDGFTRHQAVVAVIHHPGAVEALMQCIVIKRRVIARAASVAFDHVQIGQAELVQLFHQIVEQRLRLAFAGIVDRRYWREAHADAAAADFSAGRGYYFQQQAAAIFNAAAVDVGTVIRAVAQETVEQIAVCTVDFNAIETGVHGASRRLAEVVDYARDICQRQFTRHRSVDITFAGHKGLGVGADCGWGYRRLAVRLEGDVRHAAGMPDLHHDAAAFFMHGVCDFFPGGDLFRRMQAWRVGVTLGLG